MNIKDMQKIADQKGIGMKDLPNEFIAEVTDTTTTIDDYGTTVFIATLKVNGKELKVSYKPMHVEELVKALQKINVDEFKGTFKFVKHHFEIGFDRPLPIEYIL